MKSPNEVLARLIQALKISPANPQCFSRTELSGHRNRALKCAPASGEMEKDISILTDIQFTDGRGYGY